MLYLVNYLAASLACAVTLSALGWPHSVAGGALVCAVAALASVAVLYGIRPARLAGWHRRRSRALVERQASISAIWGPLAIAGWLALAILESVHIRIAGWLS